jgi:transposase-like protein
MEEAWLDVTITRCPNCGRFYADASWYIVEMASDTQCGSCHKTFNTKTYLTDRIMLRLKVNGTGKVEEVEVAEHL